jgi:hypothetical protein
MIIEFVFETVNPVLIGGSNTVVESNNPISQWVCLRDQSLISEQLYLDSLLGEAVVVGCTQLNTQNQQVSVLGVRENQGCWDVLFLVFVSGGGGIIIRSAELLILLFLI